MTAAEKESEQQQKHSLKKSRPDIDPFGENTVKEALNGYLRSLY